MHKIIHIENAYSTTGAYKSLLSSCRADKTFVHIWVLPVKSSLIKEVQKEFTVYSLPFSELGKSIIKIIVYFPLLFINGYRLSRIIKKENPDIIHINDLYNLTPYFALWFCKRKVPVNVHARMLKNSFPAFIYKLWVKIHLRHSKIVIAVSHAVKKDWGNSPKVKVLYGFLSLQEKIFDNQILKDFSVIKLLYVSNYTRGKGQNYALQAFTKAYNEISTLRLKFVGGDMGLKKNKRFKQELQKEVDEKAMNDVVTFGDFSDNIEKEIKEADIILNFSVAESFSMTCLEASYFGKPVIATRCGGPEEIILHGETGLLVENKNVEEMVAAILQLAGDKGKRIQFGNSGRQYVREKFSIETYKKESDLVFCDK